MPYVVEANSICTTSSKGSTNMPVQKVSWWERRQARKKAERLAAANAEKQPYILYKFQRPLLALHNQPTMLVYDEQRVNVFEVPYDATAGAELFRGLAKVYAWGRFNHDINLFQFDESREVIRDTNEFPEW